MKIQEIRKDGKPLHIITDDLYQYAFFYFTENKWLDCERLVILRNADHSKTEAEFFHAADLVLIDMKQETETLLTDHRQFGGVIWHLVHENRLFFVTDKNCLWMKDLDNGDTVLIYKSLDHQMILGISITNNGKYLGLFSCPKDPFDTCKFYRIDLSNFAVEVLFEKRFEKPFFAADHFMICPTDENKVFFTHEGDTFYISNRMWLWEKGRGMRNLTRQRLDKDGNIGDCFGHECWEPGGKGLYFVKYKCSPTPPTGICYTDTEGNQTDVLYGKYPYWHVSTSPNGRFLGADTQSESYSGVVLIDTKKAEEHLLFRADTTWSHPCHPHPMFSPDSNQLCFHTLHNGKIVIAVFDISAYND